MKKNVLLMVLLVAIAGVGQAYGADDIEALKKEIANQYDVILKMQLKLDQMGNGSSVSASKASALKFGGDFRYRHESIDTENGDRNDRNRIRARISMNAKINDETMFDIRIASGSEDPVSTNATLDGAFSSKSLWLDRAYLTWSPAAVPGLSTMAGKFGVPFVQVGGNQLIWDGDLNPEGLAASYRVDLMEGVNLFTSGGGFWADQRGAGNASAAVWGVQGGLKYTYEDLYVLGGASYFDYTHVENNGALYDGKFFGNTNDAGGFANDYNIVELFAECGTDALGLPLVGYGNYVFNTEADNEETGWMLGLNVNKLKDPGSWSLGYAYRDLEDDAVVGAFSDSDFIGGGTNGSGHLFSAGYQLAKNVAAGVTYLRNSVGEAETDYDRYQFDVMLKF